MRVYARLYLMYIATRYRIIAAEVYYIGLEDR